MALDTERSEEHPLTGGLTALKSGASDAQGVIADAGRRLVQASRKTASSALSKAAAALTGDRKSTRLNSSHSELSRMPSSA